MEIRTEELKRCEIVRVAGHVDSATAPELEERLLAEIGAGHRNLVVNLSAVDYISSAGLKALLAALIRTRNRRPGGDVVISELPAKLKETFELVGLTHLFKFCDSDVEAVGSF
jgi:anti-sigma B factor antagonist